MASYVPPLHSAAAEKDLGALPAMALLAAAPLIGFLYFLLFPFVAAVLALFVVGGEVVKALRPGDASR